MMTRRQANAGLLASAVLATPASRAAAPAALAPMAPPPAQTQGGMPLMTALALRRSTRAYTDRALPLQTLSDLLWAAFGVNRPGGDRTAPYWRHVMVIDVYACMAGGTWVYEPHAHRLLPHLASDLRARTGMQDFVGGAPLNLVYVAHGERMTDVSPEERRLYASVDAAFIGQNVYLYCASAGLGSVFRGALDTGALAQALHLPAGQFVTFAQTVGFPAD
jgi:nitroreductase